MPKWGYSAPNKIMCVSCENMHLPNEPCSACGKYLCEACFQLKRACCAEMKIIDGKTGQIRIPDMFGFKEFVRHKSMLNPHLNVLQCMNKDCLYRSMFGKYQEPAIIVKKEYRYCPMCGGDAEIVDYNIDEYWKLLSKHYKVPANMLKELHSLWDRDEHDRFVDFVQAFVKEAVTS